MLYTFIFLTSLATLATLLTPEWSWTNASLGALGTHVLIGHLHASKAIDACCFPTQKIKRPRYALYRDDCVLAWVKLVAVELSGSVFFGVFGKGLGREFCCGLVERVVRCRDEGSICVS